MDFRTEAGAATMQRLSDPSAVALSGLGESGCLPIPGGRATHCWVELPVAFISLLGLLGTLSIVALRVLGVLSPAMTLPLLLGTLVVSLLVRSLKSLILKSCLSSRNEGFLKAFPDLPQRTVGVENGLTFHKVKWVTEDSGVCLLDEMNRRIVIEGCEYRYVFRANDVKLVEPLSGYALSGARVFCRMAGKDMNIVLKAAGQGPLASLVQAFAPRVGATGLATELNKTLFGVQKESFAQPALPPPLPKV